MEQGFDLLDWPVQRVCSAEVPMPYAKHLEEAALPRAETIVAAVRGDARLMWEFTMPILGADMSSGTLTRWLKKPGDEVRRGDIIAVVETDKADVEVEVFGEGVIERFLVEPGTKVPVGTPLAVLSGEGAPAPAEAPPPVIALTPEVRGRAVPPVTAPAAAAHLLISPSARQLAEELGLDPATIAGTGPGGRIQRKDVEAAAAGGRDSSPHRRPGGADAAGHCRRDEPLEPRDPALLRDADDRHEPRARLARPRQTRNARSPNASCTVSSSSRASPSPCARCRS